MTGNCWRASAAACWPISTSWAGVYLLAGGVICVCAASTAENSRNARGTDRFMQLGFANSSPRKCGQMSLLPRRSEADVADAATTREQLVILLNEDLSREYQAII